VLLILYLLYVVYIDFLLAPSLYVPPGLSILVPISNHTLRLVELLYLETLGGIKAVS